MKKKFTMQFEKVLIFLLFIVLPYTPIFAQADAGTDQEVCVDQTNLSANSIQTGTWSVISGTAIIMNSNSFSTLVTNLSVGVNIFRWTAPAETPTTDDVQITYTVLTADAGIDQNISLAESQFEANDPTLQGAWGNWAIISGMGTVANPTLYNSLVAELQNGTNTFQWTVNNGNCSVSDNVNITVSLTPPDAGPDQEICMDSTNLDAQAIEGGFWTLSSFNTGSPPEIVSPTLFNTKVRYMDAMYSPFEFVWNASGTSDTIVVVNNTTYAYIDETPSPLCSDELVMNANVPSFDEMGLWASINTAATFDNPTSYNTWARNLAPGENQLSWTVTKGSCTAQDIAYVNNNSVIADAGPDGESCDSTYIMQANIPISGSGNWQQIDGGIIVDQTLHNTLVTNLSSGINRFEWMVNSGGCSALDTVFITNNAVTADAGIDQSVCDTSAMITGNTPLGDEFGDWTPVNTSVYFDDPSMNNTMVRMLDVGANQLAWTISKGICSASDTVVVTNNLTIANAGPDGESCDNAYTLQANEPQTGSGQWTALDGGTIVDQTLYNTEVTTLGEGTSRFEWYVNSSGCSSIDTVAITNNTVTADAGIDQSVCDSSASVIGNTPPGGAFGDWTPVNTSIYFDEHSMNSTIVRSLDPGSNQLVWTISRGICSVSDTVIVTYLNNYFADAGPDNAVYSSNYPDLIDTIVLNAVTPSEGAGIWSVVQGPATVDNTLAPNSVVHNLQHGANIFRWTISNESCSSFDEVLITAGYSFMPGDTVTQLDWTDPDDWDNGITPGEGDSVTIVNVDAFLQGDTAYCHALYISSGSEFNISDDGALFADGIDLSKNNFKFKSVEGEAHMIVAGDGILKIGYGTSSLKAAGNSNSGGLRISTGGSVIIEQDAEKATGSGGLLSVRNGSIIIEQDAEKATGNGGSLTIRGSVIIEQDAEKATSFKSTSTGNNLYIRSGGSVIIEQDAEKSTAAGGSLHVRGGSVIIEQDAEKSTYAGGSLHVRSGSVIIEQDAEKSTSLKSTYSGKLIVRGGSVIIEQDAEKTTYKTEIIAPSTEIYHGQILIGKLSNTKVTGSGLRTGSIIIEQDAEKSTDVDTSLIIKTGGSLLIDENLNQGADYSLLLNSNTYVTFEKGSFIDLDYAQTGNPKPIVIKQNASLLDMNDANQLHGKFEHLFIQNQNEQFSAPFSSINSDIFTANASINSWDEANFEWNELTGSRTYNYMEGFDILYTDANYLSTFEGTLNSGDLNFDLDYTESTNTDENGWNLCGNPYPSAIDFELYAGAAGISPCIYQYDNTSKQYKIYQKGGIALNGGIQYVVPGQAFFIHTTSSNNPLSFNNDMRLHYFTDGNTSETETPSNFLKLKVDNSTYSDETIIRFIDAATNDFDEIYDAYKLLSPNVDVPQLYSLMGTEKSKTAINSLKPSSSEATVVPINFKAGVDGTYKITATDLNFDNSVGVFLKDLKDNNTHDLKSSPEYTFTYSTSDSEERFEVQFGASATGFEHISNNFKVDIYSFGTDLYIKTFDNKDYQYEIYDMHGKLIKSEKLLKKGLNTININSPAGIYIVKVITGNNISQKSISIIN